MDIFFCRIDVDCTVDSETVVRVDRDRVKDEVVRAFPLPSEMNPGRNEKESDC